MDFDQRIGGWLTPDGCFLPRLGAARRLPSECWFRTGRTGRTGDEILITDLQRHGDYWSGTVPGVQAWQLYRFEITERRRTSSSGSTRPRATSSAPN